MSLKKSEKLVRERWWKAQGGNNQSTGFLWRNILRMLENGTYFHSLLRI